MFPALASGIHLTAVLGNIMVLNIELAITRVGFSVGVSLSWGESVSKGDQGTFTI